MTFTKGKLTSGKRSMPSRPSDTMPSTMKLTMTIVAKTGRLIEVSEIHMADVLGASQRTVMPSDFGAGGDCRAARRRPPCRRRRGP